VHIHELLFVESRADVGTGKSEPTGGSLFESVFRLCLVDVVTCHRNLLDYNLPTVFTAALDI
jgi:hypothetical protein